MKEDIKDNEIRIIGSSYNRQPMRSISQLSMTWGNVLLILAIIIILISSGIAIYVYSHSSHGSQPEIGIYDPLPASSPNLHPLSPWLEQYDSLKDVAGCAIKDTLVNDIMVRVYLPLNARPALCVGIPRIKEQDVILAFQAADIRADNKKIVGAFVEKGIPLAWGLSKKGYCAILGDSVYIGTADNTSLFERATECEGYFFRQYPLVDNRVPQPSELKSQAIRRALCEIDGHQVVVETLDRASMHDFAVLLVDLGVNNAIYLIGSDAITTVTDLDGNRTPVIDTLWKPYKYINFIYWSKR